MFIRLENGAPIGHPVNDYNFRTLFPGVSFPKYLTVSDVEPLNFGLYEYSQQPSLAKYEKLVEATPVRSENGIWYQNWHVVEMNTEEKLQEDKEKAHMVRQERVFKLASCDWTQLADSPVDGSLWLTYRQALRDVPSQNGFPWEVVWPEQPAN